MNMPPLARATVLFALLAGGARAQTATFDGFVEGGAGPTVTDAGLVFSDLDRYLGSSSAPFAIEQADGTLAGLPGFGAPNALAFGGWSPGPASAFSRCGRFTITPPGVRQSAEVPFFVLGSSSSSGNQVRLSARLGGVEVAADTVVLPTSGGVQALVLSVAGASFDELEVVGSGPMNSGAFFAVFDSVRVEGSPGTTFCAGDGSGAACPCGNTGAAGEGCANSTGAGGELTALGAPSVAADTLELAGSGLPATAPGLYFQGTDTVGGGAGVAFGDGVRCVSGTVVRLGTVPSSAGASSFPPGGGTGIAALGGVAPGDRRHYQLWYRNVVGPCGFGYNLTNGLSIDWQP